MCDVSSSISIATRRAPFFKLIEVAFELTVPLIVSTIIDVGIENGDKVYIIKRCLLLGLLGILGLCSTLVAQYFSAKASVGFATDIRHALFKHIGKLSYSQLDSLGAPTLITRLTGDINQVQTGTNLTLRLVLRSPFVVFGAVIMAFTVDVKSSLVFVVAVPALAAVVVDIAKSQVGNVGGQPYWSWYGFNSRVEWCACFVSWCYGQMGLSEPRFAACQSQGIPWFQSHGQWGGRDYANIAPGDAIFFDWDLDGSADHVGLVVGTDGSRVYTVEGNSGDACKIKSYSLSYECIKGYGLMNW